MSLRCADQGRRCAWSITGKLTLLYALFASILLLLSAMFLYWVLASNMEHEDSQFLSDKIHVLRMILREHTDAPALLKQEVEWEGATSSMSQHYAYYSRILDASGGLLLETPGMGTVIPANAFPSPADEARETANMLHWLGKDGRTYLMTTAWASSGNSQSDRLLQIALDVSREDALIADYRHKLIAVLVLGVLLSGAIGALVARRGMRPLREITRTIERITASQLHERIEPARWPKELSTLADAFDQMLGRLEQSFIQLSQFSADLAHELRTPINNLMGEAETALSGARTPQDYRLVLESSLEEYSRLSRMTDSLLFLARAESAQTCIERTRLYARAELEAVCAFYQALADDRGVAISCQDEAGLDADPLLLRRALSNLLANALRHTLRGGQIELAVQTTDTAIEVSVADSGCGIAPEHLPRIFDRFYRVDSARAHSAEGAGLGLSIVKSIMALHGGSVHIASIPGKGTTVTLIFPAANAT